MKVDDGSLREFGEFLLDVEQKVLSHRGRPVQMPMKEIELLCLLVEKSGKLVTKNDIIENIWPNSFVEESNLSRHIYLLRKALSELGADDLIENVPRRGYRFKGNVRRSAGNGLFVERHSFTKTVIEELPEEDFQKPGSVFKILQQFRSKWIAVSLALTILLAAGFALTKYSSNESPGAGRTQVRSIAVLPFKSLGPANPENIEGAGFTDLLITKLGSLQGLTVRPPGAVSGFGKEENDSIGIGEKLKVDAVLEGTIYRRKEDVRITARLISVHDKSQIWTGHFEKAMRDEFKLQNEVALQLVNVLSIRLNKNEAEALRKEYTDNSEAYRLYVEGRYHWNKRSNPGMAEAERLFRNAIEKDPEFALAYVGLADTLGMLQDQKEAVSAIETALRLDPDLAEAHAALGFSKMFRDWDWKNAEKALGRAIELNPGYPSARQWYSTLLSVQGRFGEAGREMERALEIHPTSQNFLADRGQLFYFAGDYKKAEEYCRKSLEIYPGFVPAHSYLADIYLMTGAFGKSIDESYQAALIQQDYPSQTTKNKALISKRYAEEAEAFKRKGVGSFLKNRLQIPHETPNVFYNNAQIYAFLGNNSAALDNLESAYKQRAFMMAFVKADPKFASLRSEPRFQAILKKMGLSG